MTFLFNTHTIGTGMKTNPYKNTENIITNLKKSQSSITKIIKMIQKDEYCMDIMQQNLAVVGLIKSAQQMLMEKHLNTCFRHAMESTNKKRKQEMIDEILKVINLAGRK